MASTTTSRSRSASGTSRSRSGAGYDDAALRVVPIRVVVAEDHYLLREGIRRLLEAQPGIEVAAVCGDLESLLAAVDAERPDVVVTDIRMPPGGVDEGIQAAARLRETNPDTGVVVLSQYAEPGYALALFESGTPRPPSLLTTRIQAINPLAAPIPP